MVLSLLPILKDLDDLPHICTLTLHRAGLELLLTETVFRTFITARCPCFKNGSAIQIRKPVNLNPKCSPTGMVEQKKSFREILKMDLIPDYFYVGIP